MKLQVSPTRVSFQNILVATDFSAPSVAALPHAAAFASHFGAKLHLAHVVAPGDSRAAGRMANLISAGGLQRIPHAPLLRQGKVAETLQEIIWEREIDLLVLGIRGYRGMRGALLGPVAEAIFPKAPCSILTIGPGAREAPPSPALTRIVCGLDFPEVSDSAVRYALSLAQEFLADLTFLHVCPGKPPDAPEEAAVLAQTVQEKIQDLVPAETEYWCQPGFSVAFGSPGEVILKEAEQRSADLIVLGAHEPEVIPWSTSFRRGQVAPEVIVRAPSPVLSVRSPAVQLAELAA